MMYYRYAVALLFITTGCMAEQADSRSLVEIRVVPGADLDEVFPLPVRDELEITDQFGRSGPIVIGKPHRLRLQVGDREVVVSPGGYNSRSYVTNGYFVGDALDDRLVRSISAGSGEELFTRSEAKALAVEWCGTAEEGLKAKSRLDPDEVISHGNFADARRGSSSQLTPICDLENELEGFSLSLSGPADQEGRPLDNGERSYRVIVYFSQNIPLPSEA